MKAEALSEKGHYVEDASPVSSISAAVHREIADRPRNVNPLNPVAAEAAAQIVCKVSSKTAKEKKIAEHSLHCPTSAVSLPIIRDAMSSCSSVFTLSNSFR